ncbi:MAG: hypothetical protein WBA22_13845 [Candidatus Methanofastidiosia archaeon]
MRKLMAVVLLLAFLQQSAVQIPAQSFSIEIWVERGCGGTYYVGEMLKVYWEASHGCEITFYEKEPDGTRRKLHSGPIFSGEGRGSRGWTIKDYGYGLREIQAYATSEFGSDSDSCQYYVREEDSDGDGVPDDEDDCYSPSCDIVDSHGCPRDSDGDGLNDCEDDCPSEYGTSSNNGCPAKDSDGDGVLDEQDMCYNPGCIIIDSQGCPKDSDGDGSNDCEDDCPSEYGDRSNNGCKAPPISTNPPSTSPGTAPASSSSSDWIPYLFVPVILGIIMIPLFFSKARSTKTVKPTKPTKPTKPATKKTSVSGKKTVAGEKTRAYDDDTRVYDEETRSY